MIRGYCPPQSILLGLAETVKKGRSNGTGTLVLLSAGILLRRIRSSSEEITLLVSITPEGGKFSPACQNCLRHGGEESMKNLIARLSKEEEGQDLTEYGLLLVMVALAAIATMNTLASAISNVFSNAASSLSTT